MGLWYPKNVPHLREPIHVVHGIDLQPRRRCLVAYPKRPKHQSGDRSPGRFAPDGGTRIIAASIPDRVGTVFLHRLSWAIANVALGRVAHAGDRSRMWDVGNSLTSNAF